MRNEIDFLRATQETSRKQYPLRNRSPPKTIEKHSSATKYLKLQTYG